VNRLVILAALLAATSALAAETPPPATATPVPLITLTPAPTPAQTTTPAPPPAPAAQGVTGWTMNGGVVGKGQNVVIGEVGFPGLDATFLHGLSERFDVGGMVSFDYAIQGAPDSVAPGFKIAAIARLSLVNQAKLNVGVRVSPGFIAYFPTEPLYFSDFRVGHSGRSVSMFGLQIPVELTVGIQPMRDFSLHVGVSMPLTLVAAPDFSFLFPIEPGIGAEYKIDEHLSLTFDSRFGPSVFMVPTRSEVHFAFRALVGVAYRL
jgi:hypothetical protein